jgi:hypothetical protein
MSTIDDFEREYLEANPNARSASYVPSAPTRKATSMTSENDPNSDLNARDLAEAAAFALTPEGRRIDPHAAQAIWEERVRRAEREMQASGPVAPAPGAQSAEVSAPIDESAWRDLSALSRTPDPRTAQPYVLANSPEGSFLRHMLDEQRQALFRGEPVDPELLAHVRAAIAADLAAFEAEKKAQEARELAEFRKERQT